MDSVLTVDGQNGVKKSAQLLTKLLKLLWAKVEVGNSGSDLVTATWSFLRTHRCHSNFYRYQGFPAPICVSVNSAVIHGIPDDNKFKAGDIVSVDAGVLYQQKWHSDAAFTKIVGSCANPSDQLLVMTCAQALRIAISQLQPNIRTGTLGASIAHYVRSQGFFWPNNYTGHAIGLALHMKPIVPNSGRVNTGDLLRPGMVVCVEPMVMAQTADTTTAPDGWTVHNAAGANAAHFEAMILIKSSGIELLTPILV